MTDTTEEQVEAKLAALREEPEVMRLHEALELLEEAERDVPPGRSEERRRALARRLRFLAVLEHHIDPDWDPEDKPVQGAPPPPSAEGPVKPSGEVDPSNIADPDERAAYVRALEASRAYRKWYDLQHELRRVEARAMRFAERFVAERYAGSPDDRRELEELLQESEVTAARRERLRAAAEGGEGHA